MKLLNRYLVVDYLNIPNGLKVYAKSKEEVEKKYPNYDIERVEDTEHLGYIEELKSKSKMYSSQEKDGEFKELYEYSNTFGDLEYCLTKDLNDNHYYDYAEYIFVRRGRNIEPVMRIITSPKDLYNKFMNFPSFQYEVISSSKPGVSMKLDRPPELKGVKQLGSAKCGKVSNQIFVKGNDLYIKCNDYLSPLAPESPDEIGTPLNYRMEKHGLEPKSNKFIYEDNWGAIVLRRGAWIKFTSFVNLLDLYDDAGLAKLCCRMIEKYHDFDEPLEVWWTIMFVSICKQVRSYSDGLYRID